MDLQFLADNDIPLDLALECKRLAEIPKEEFEALIEEGKRTGKLLEKGWLLNKWNERQ